MARNTGRAAGIAACALALAVVTHRLWLTALGTFLVEADPPRHTEMLLVLGGDSYGHRILRAGELIRLGYAPRALVSCAEKFYDLPECNVAIPFAARHGFPASYFIPLRMNALSTREEAAVALAELRRRKVRSAGIVTSGYHTRRARNIYQSMAQGMVIYVFAAPDEYFRPDNWWKGREARKTFLLEWSKTAANWAGV